MTEIVQDLTGKTRNIPVSPEYIQRIERIASTIDPTLGVTITSGGQPRKGTSTKRTGSTRHDIDEHGHAETSDLVLTRNGKPILPGEDKALYSRFLEEAAANGFSGIGHYDWGVHVGGGSRAAWGPTTGSASLDPQFGDAIKRGWSRGPNAPFAGPAVPPEMEVLKGDLSYSGGSTSTPNETPIYVPDKPEPGLFQSVADSFLSEQSAVWAYRAAFGPNFDDKFSPDYRLTDERIMEDFGSKGIDPAIYVDKLKEVGSDDEYEHVRGLIHEDSERRQRLAQAGMTGTVLTVANQMLDIGTLPADIAIGAVAPQVLLAKKATRLHRALVGALSASAGAAAAEGLATTVNPHRDASDVFYGAVFGLGFGGLAGSLMKNPNAMEEALQVESLGRSLAGQAENGWTGAPGSVGAASVGMTPNKPFLDDHALSLIQDGEVAQTFGSKVRFSLGGKLHGSKNPLARLAAYLVQDGVGKKGENVNGIAVTEEVSRLTGEMMGAYHRAYNPALDAFLKSNKYSMLDRDAGTVAFNEQVTAFIRDREFGRVDRYAKEVAQVGRKIAEINDELRKMAANPLIREGLTGRAVAGFDRIADDPHYIMRVWDARKIADARTKHGSAVIEELIAGAMRKANPSVPEDLLLKAARGFARGIEDRAFGIDELTMKNIGAENVDDLVETLTMHGGLTKQDAADLIHRITHKSDDAGRDGVAKCRTLMDETFRLPSKMSVHGVMGDGLGITDLTVNDATHLTATYVRRMAGLVGLARFRVRDPKTGEILVDGITKDSEWDTFLRAINKRGADLGAAGKQSQGEREYDMKGLQFAYDMIKGRPVQSAFDGAAADWMRTVREYNFARVGGQLGFAQLPEFGNIIGTLGVKAAFSHMPALRRILSTSGESIRKDDFAHDLEIFVPVGDENLVHRSASRFDEFSGAPNSLDRGTRQQKAEGIARKLSRATAVASGMAHVNEMLQTMVARGIVQKFAIMAHKANGKGFSVKRLADMGLDPKMAERIYGQFRAEGNFEYAQGMLTGKRIVRANFDNWTDKGAREAFRNAVYRLANSTVQKNDLGNIPMWMNGNVGRSLMQFRMFVVAAWEKQTLRSAHLRDFPAFASAMLAMTFAGVGYTVQEKLRAVGRPDADEYLDKRLSWENIGKAALSRSGWASIGPMVMDSTVSGAIFGKPQFDFRTTGQGQEMLLGNPTMGLIFNDGPLMAAGITRPFAEDRGMSQQEARAIARVAPFQNFLPVAGALNWMIGDLPVWKPREAR